MPRKTKKQKLAIVTKKQRSERRLLKDKEESARVQEFISKNYFTRPSTTSFGSHKPKPLWKSVLFDYFYLLRICFQKS